MYKKSKLASAVLTVLAASATPNLHAQENEASEADVELIQVTGIRASMSRAMDVKQDSGGVVDSIRHGKEDSLEKGCH